MILIIYALNASNSDIIRKSDMGLFFFLWTWRDRLIVYSPSGEIYALNIPVERTYFQPVGTENRIIVISNDTVYLLDGTDGDVIWKSRRFAEINAEPVVDSERIYISTELKIIALNKTDGSLLW